MAAIRSTYTRLRSHLNRTLSLLSPNPNPPSLILNPPPSILLSHLSPFSIPIPNPTFSIRHLSTLRRAPGRTVDIGARARQIQKRRLWSYGLSFSCVAGFIVIVLSTFQDQMVFYVTPTDAIEKFASNPSKNRFRLGGLVLEGSVRHPASSKEMEFVVTDLVTDILVRYEGMLPDLFREGHSVVVEGLMTPFGESGEEGGRGGGEGRGIVAEKARSMDYYFAASEVLAKHDEKYMPREVAVAINKNKKQIEAVALEEEERRNGVS